MLKVEIVDLAARAARVIVPDYQLSLAIGKEGQNARLAARLTGWRIDIRPDGDPTTTAAARRRGGRAGPSRTDRVAWLGRRAPPGPHLCRAAGSAPAHADLLRVVAVEGAVVPDPARPAARPRRYLHRDLACLDLAERRKALPAGAALPGAAGRRTPCAGCSREREALDCPGPRAHLRPPARIWHARGPLSTTVPIRKRVETP